MTIDELERELTDTRRGFAARVEPPAGVRNVGMTFGVMGLLVTPFLLVPGRRRDLLVGLGLWAVVALVVVLLGLVRERLSLKPLRERYLARGWVSRQAPTGLVKDSSDEGNGVVRRDLGLGSAGRDDGTPVVLVGGPGVSRESIESAAAAAREHLMRMTPEQARAFSLRVHEEGLYRDWDASRHFPVPSGMSVTVQTGRSPYVLVVPAVNGSGRPRYYGVRERGPGA